ncbi:nucleoside deaminase [Sporosarcina pasteurii]|uniref:Guanine deaminase n=1 Tax=Sporosarcina pasteurii TaxID=1474 RepID=A0A380CJM4_SPOPA|nr:nucleoside deaminase [Sporosarcina pasteurii]MDS9472108.1 nucleoside deaminase [Sporosarcina pasteurii]QBQ06826.1 nucleoside deaminase [Sporosarcina pasteurii]SUJ20770.1 Guanine deaminase [Sporosarcina pasteurii]
MNHKKWLDKTVQMAVDNVKNGGGPFAAIVVKDGKIIGSGTNLVHQHNDPSAHAELLAIREACAELGSTNLSSAILYASGEPCPMCLGAAYWASVGNIYYACSKNEALQHANFSNPLAAYFPDQEKAPEDRQIPFIQISTNGALTPFHEWNKRNNE